MGGFSLGIAIESLVAVLLAVTIGYCVLVNRKLAQLRSDQSELKNIVRALHLATDQAANAITGLRESAADADESLGAQLERVKILDKQLRQNIGRGDALLAKLSAMPRASEIGIAERSREAVARPSAQAAAPARSQAPAESSRQSKIGLGLLNVQRRNAAGAPNQSSREEVAA
jgi:hypothetical protein